MENERFFFTEEEKIEYIEKEADRLNGNTTLNSHVYIGIDSKDIDEKSNIFKVLDTDGTGISFVAYEEDGLLNIETTFPEITKGEKFYNFIKENFKDASVEIDVMEVSTCEFACPTCGSLYSEIEDALWCHIEDCREQLIETLEDLIGG